MFLPSGLSRPGHSGATSHFLTQWCSKPRKEGRPCPVLWTFFNSKGNFPKVSEQTSHWCHWWDCCHMTIPKPISGKWDGIIIIPLDQLSFPLALGKGQVSPGKHLAAWQVNKVWALSPKEIWLVCVQSQCLSQQGAPNVVLSYLWSLCRWSRTENPDFFTSLLLAFPNILYSLSTSCPDGHRRRKTSFFPFHS